MTLRDARKARGRAAVGLAILLGGATALTLAVAACFPDYEVGAAAAGDGSAGDTGNSGDSGTGDTGAGDSTLPGEGSAGDSATGKDSTTGKDGSVTDASTVDVPVILNDAIAAYDGNPLSNMIKVDGGTFYFQINEVPFTVDAEATLTYTAAIDQTEVTVGQFAQFLDAVGKGWTITDGATLDPGGPYQGVMTWQPAQWMLATSDILGDQTYTGSGCGVDVGTPGPTWGGNANYPINCVPWPQALAFCAWQGKRLPTETEWRYFATERGSNNVFPWGNAAADCNHVIWDIDAGCNFPQLVGSATLGATKEGVFDLAGSVSEWLWDWLPPNYTYPQVPVTNYAGPAEPVDASMGYESRMWMENDFGSNADYYFYAAVGRPSESEANYGFDNCGFRCAKSLP